MFCLTGSETWGAVPFRGFWHEPTRTGCYIMQKFRLCSVDSLEQGHQRSSLWSPIIHLEVLPMDLRLDPALICMPHSMCTGSGLSPTHCTWSVWHMVRPGPVCALGAACVTGLEHVLHAVQFHAIHLAHGTWGVWYPWVRSHPEWNRNLTVFDPERLLNIMQGSCCWGQALITGIPEYIWSAWHDSLCSHATIFNAIPFPIHLLFWAHAHTALFSLLPMLDLGPVELCFFFQIQRDLIWAQGPVAFPPPLHRENGQEKLERWSIMLGAFFCKVASTSYWWSHGNELHPVFSVFSIQNGWSNNNSRQQKFIGMPSGMPCALWTSFAKTQDKLPLRV